MRKVASNRIYKEEVRHLYFLCQQEDGYRIIKEIKTDNKQQVCTFYQNGYGVLLLECGNLLDSVYHSINTMSGKVCVDEYASDYDAKKRLIKECAMFLGQSAISICEIESLEESCEDMKDYLTDNELHACILCLFD